MSFRCLPAAENSLTSVPRGSNAFAACCARVLKDILCALCQWHPFKGHLYCDRMGGLGERKERGAPESRIWQRHQTTLLRGVVSKQYLFFRIFALYRTLSSLKMRSLVGVSLCCALLGGARAASEAKVRASLDTPLGDGAGFIHAMGEGESAAAIEARDLSARELQATALYSPCT